jgi:transglutaminase-like putative cysteine protease
MESFHVLEVPGRYPNTLIYLREQLPAEVQKLLSEGRVKEAGEILGRLLLQSSSPLKERFVLELERLRRLPHEYPYSLSEALSILRKDIPDLAEGEFQELVKRGCIDHANIQGELRVHRRFKPNAYWLCSDLKRRRGVKSDERSGASEVVLKWRAERVVQAARGRGGFVLPLRYHVKAAVKLKGPACRYGDVVRVWIPIPREEATNVDFKVIDSSAKPRHVAPPTHPQRTVYFELEGEDREVWVEYTYVSRGFHVEIDPREVSQDLNPEVAAAYTSERPPHITFTETIRKLAQGITRKAASPLEKVQRIWQWITENVRYTYAKDYIFYDDIPEYVAREKRGDCGMQALLFITLCRASGIPARWESGWYMNPLSPGMHDWAQFYLEPYGWLYADPSFGNKRKGGEWRNKFYLGSIEGYRLASNVEVYAEFDPPKTHIRSDPVDSQRGEVETAEKNLFYDEWDFTLEVLSVESLEE